jgi:hypothetical protein
MMSLDIPPKVVEALRKICRAFLWKGRQEVKGGHCLVAWDKVTSPKDHGGLGIPNLHLLNLALRCRWAWLQKVDPSKAWAEFNIQLPSLCTAIFDAATCYVLGNGERARFWSDRWLDGSSVAEIAPNVAKMVSRRRITACSVREGLAGQWLRDCGPDMDEAALPEFFMLWQRLANVQLVPEREDVLLWRWSTDGIYSAQSAYRAFFAGQVRAPISEEIWRSRAPYSCKFFAWLASKNRCWTADRLRRRGLPCPSACPLCDQEPETLQHLLLGCVVARETWAWALRCWGREEWLPDPDTDLLEWWTSRACPTAHRRDMWTAIILVFWCIWRHRNDVVFNGAVASHGAIRDKVREEFERWRLAKLFRGTFFVFLDLTVVPWQDGA